MRMAAVLVLATTALLAGGASADPAGEPAVVHMTLRDHRFSPDTVVAPADRPLRVELVNEDDAPEQVESPDLGVAQDVAPHGRASLALGPLKPGRYTLKGELHAGAAVGLLQVIPAP